VIQMRSWDRYENWKGKLAGLGYKIREQVLNSADFNVPQSRKRLFIVCDLEAEPPPVKPPSSGKPLPADSVISKNGLYRFSLLRSERRAAATLERADRAIDELGDDHAFLLVYYGTDGAGGWQRVDTPLRTITTVDRFAYVRPDGNGQHEMRMLQVPELKQAMGFPGDYKLLYGTRRDKIKLLGNAVCPPVMKAIVEAVTIDHS
jgi:DNA (cytosine-5)-methyltransferase 1